MEARIAPIPTPFCTPARESPDALHVNFHHCGSGSRGVGRKGLKTKADRALIAIEIALYEPDIAQNTGAVLRLGACFGVSVHIIEPAGFDASDRALKRAALDYIDHVSIRRHASFGAFETWRAESSKRLILLTTKAELPYVDHKFSRDDLLLLGRESAGVPDHVHNAADARIIVPMAPKMRSLNVAMAAAVVLGEALRQTEGFPAA